MSISISNINLYADAHRNIVMKLCERNKFCEDDVYAELYRDAPPHLKKRLNTLDKRLYRKFMDNLNERFSGLESNGYFIIIEKNDKKKVVGFIIYNINESIQASSLLFILIDKKYQNNGLGTILVTKYIQEVDDKKLLGANVKIIDEKVEKFYKKMRFDEYPDLIKSEKGQYKVLHYIPADTLHLLRAFKCIEKLDKSSQQRVLSQALNTIKTKPCQHPK
jgi:GNAT superfamily N-acetyltransferase